MTGAIWADIPDHRASPETMLMTFSASSCRICHDVRPTRSMSPTSAA
jgi:hypothetical protein